MQFSFRAAAVLAFVAKVLAQNPTEGFDVVSSPTDWQKLETGDALTIKWNPVTYVDETITISLIGGAEQNLQVPIKDIQTGVANSKGSFTWNIDADLGTAAVYGLVLKLESNTAIFQYSFPFTITKGEVKDESYPEPTTVKQGVKTVSLSETYPEPTKEAPVIVTVPCNTTTIPVHTQINTIVVPCNGTCPGAPSSYAPPPVVPSVPTEVPVVPTPIYTPPAAAGAGRVGASIAVVGGLIMAALAL